MNIERKFSISWEKKSMLWVLLEITVTLVPILKTNIVRGAMTHRTKLM